MKNYKNLQLARKLFDEHGVKLVFVYGSLIGMARDQRPISYDNGHDAFILEQDIEKFLKLGDNIKPYWEQEIIINEKLLGDLKKNNVRFTKKGISTFKLDINGEQLCLFCMHKIGIKYYECFTNGNIYSNLFLDDPVECKEVIKGWGHDFSFLIPKYHDKFLEGIYTDKNRNQNWKIPSRHKSNENSSCSPHYVLLDAELNMTSKQLFHMTKTEFKNYDSLILMRHKIGFYDTTLLDVFNLS